MKARFYNDHDFLPTFEEREEDLLWIWENCDDRKGFERYLEVKEPELYQHFRDNVLVNHPEYDSSK